MTKHYEITDGNLHVGWASEDYMFIKMDERVLKGEANFDFHIGEGDAVDVVPVKHGHWVYDKYNKHIPKCSVCGNFLDMRGVNVGRGDANYCPNCGAIMDEKENRK